VMGEHCWPSAGTEARGSYQSTRGPVDQTRCVDGYTKSLQEPSSSPRLLERIKTWRDTLDPQHQQSASDLWACLDPKFSPKFYYVKRRFPITSKCR
jgi:hypothetical protein